MDIVNDVVNTLTGNPTSVVSDVADGISVLTGGGSSHQQRESEFFSAVEDRIKQLQQGGTLTPQDIAGFHQAIAYGDVKPVPGVDLQQTPLVAGTNPFLNPACPPRPFPYHPPEVDPNQLLNIIQQLLSLLSQVLGSRFQPPCNGPQIDAAGAPGLGGSPAGAPIDPGYCPQPGSQGIGGLLDNLNTGAISNQVDSLMQDGEQAAMNGDPLTAQKDMEKAQIMYETISNLMNVIGELQKTAVQNSKLA